MNYTYIIIDDNQECVLNTKAIVDEFSELVFLASANNYSVGLNLILEHKPKLIFIEIDPADINSNLSLLLIKDLYHYLKIMPKIIITTTKKDFAFEAIQYEVADYIIKPVQHIDIVKSLLKINKVIMGAEIDENQSTVSIIDKKNKIIPKQAQFVPQQNPNSERPLILCIKSYGDYRYIDAKDICYFQADNNTTDIHLNNGEMVTSFKTLKHFEALLSFPFIRIHNSYIVNRNYISRIQSGNAVCFIKNTTTKIPFSKSYKSNIELIISEFSNGNYLEI